MTQNTQTPETIITQGMGLWTGIPLDDACRLADGAVRGKLDSTLVRVALELAATAYDLETDPWEQAGWTDITAQINRKLFGASEVIEKREEPTGSLRKLYGGILETIKRRRAERASISRAREDLRKPGVLGQFLSVMSAQRREDTGKVLVMARDAGQGRHIIALGFMGTGRRMLDWMANFRMMAENGMHKGFLHLTRQFEHNAERILLPDTALRLGLPSLTLANVLEDMRGANTPFRLFMAGHSQGAAVMQIWTHRRMEEGARPEWMTGYGFASPSVATAPDADAQHYPLRHFINTDDYMPRVGARAHLGACYYFEATDAFRRRCYRLSEDKDARIARAHVEPFLSLVQGTDSCMLIGTALMLALHALPDDALGDLFAALNIPFAGHVMYATGSPLRGLLEQGAKHLQDEYRARVGVPMPAARLRTLKADMTRSMGRLGVTAWTRALFALLGAPHTLVRHSKEGDAPYTAIVMDGLSHLLTEGEAELSVFALHPSIYAIRRTPAVRRDPGRGKRQRPRPRNRRIP